MFYASLIGCHLMMKNACFEMRDDRGPYETEKQCEERIDEMDASLEPLHSFVAAIQSTDSGNRMEV